MLTFKHIHPCSFSRPLIPDCRKSYGERSTAEYLERDGPEPELQEGGYTYAASSSNSTSSFPEAKHVFQALGFLGHVGHLLHLKSA